MLNIGDNVKINCDGYKFNGLTGQILNIVERDGETYYLCPFPPIINNGGFTSLWCEEDLELINKEE